MATITIMEGMHNPFAKRDEVPSQPLDSGQTTLMNSSTTIYFNPDRFDFFRDNGFQTTQFTLAYDSGSLNFTHAIPEPSTYAMIGMGFAVMFLIRLFKTRH